MKRDIIFLLPDTKNKKWIEKKFYINVLKNKFNIKIFYFEKNSKNFKIFDMKNFFKFTKKLHEPIFMNWLDRNKKNYKIYKRIKDNDFIQMFIYNIVPKSKTKFILNYLNRYYLSFLKKLFLKKLSSFLQYDRKYKFDYDYYITNDTTVPNKKKIKMHEENYYRFLENRKNNVKKKMNYAVFIDDAPYNHPDFQALDSLPQLLNIKKYKINFNEFINFFEKYFHTKIIIAGHPRLQNSKKYKKIFNQNKLIFNKTHKLIDSSKYVIVQGSTSVNYAILNKKPILSLNSKLFYHHYQNHIFNTSRLIGSKHFYLEDIYSKLNLRPELNILKSKKYINNYLKCSSLKSNKPWKDFLIKFS